ncbi:oxaloacetate decarboxylase [Arthrobacter sp. B0490]|uniref:isocitrate lyase/PEP mutase family protein n=1 Tax=Arthrobacter sp. B0490 TaxID=2058891 RepID=UPI0015E3FC47|nr:isocitrate lyase/PEP mutase family protein [Arthrobacter sp. B0490]
MKPAARLRELLADSKLILAPGAYDALSARLVEQAGFDTVVLAGGTYSNFHYGIPDNGFITQSELIEAGRRVTAATNIPLILDFDDAGGSPLQAYRGVQLAEQAGVAALLVEDMIPATKHFWTPKTTGERWKPKLQLRSIEEMSNIIRACVEAKTSPDTVIVARSDAMSVGGFDDLAERLTAYSAAGADMLYPVGYPLLDLPTLSAKVPGQYMMVTVRNPTFEQRSQLEEAGVKILLVINTVNGAVAGFREQLDLVARGELLEGERGGAYVPIMEAIDAAEWARKARRYGYA